MSHKLRPTLPLLLSLFVVSSTLQAQRVLPGLELKHARYNFYTRTPYRNSVPRPSQILGFEAGDTHSNYREQEKTLLAIAAAAKSGDHVLIMSNGGFGGIHDKLLAQLGVVRGRSP